MQRHTGFTVLDAERATGTIYSDTVNIERASLVGFTVTHPGGTTIGYTVQAQDSATESWVDYDAATSKTEAQAGALILKYADFAFPRARVSVVPDTFDVDTDDFLFASATGPSDDTVTLATAAALPACTAAGAGAGKTLTGDANGALSVDGVVTQTNDVVLVKNQVNEVDNGIYVVTTVGDGSNPFVLTRDTDYDTDSEVHAAHGDVFEVNGGGTVNDNTFWSIVGPAVTITACFKE